LSEHQHEPWIIGITGAPGTGKTHVLARLIDYLTRTGRSFDGFLSVAGNRVSSTAGAGRYQLHFPVSNSEIELCHRVESGSPPYVFNEAAWQLTDKWLKNLESAPGKPEILILDEFGKLEAKGQGFAQFWQRVYALRPHLIILAVREGSQAALEKTLAFNFDLMIRADDRSVIEQLVGYCQTIEDWQKLGRYGAAAGALEMTVGSALHVTRIPFRGVPMAMMQSLVLLLAGNTLLRPFMVVWVSYIAAALKSLSPAGNRIRPMVAIMMQGSLFGIAVRFLGWNPAGIGVGAWLVGAWSVFQGFVFQYLFFGNALFTAYEDVQLWIWQQTGIMIVSLPVLVVFFTTLAGFSTASLTLYFLFRNKVPDVISKLLSDGFFRKKRTDGADLKVGILHKIWIEYRQKAFWIPMVLMFIVLGLSGTGFTDLTLLVLRGAGVLTAVIVVFSFLKPTRITKIMHYFGFREAGIVLGRVFK
jgi:nucleoside-triphosphatase THEP1